MRRASRRSSVARRLAVATGSLIFVSGALALGLAYVVTSLWIDNRVDDSLQREFDSLVPHHSREGPDALSDEIERRIQAPRGDRLVYIYAESRYQRIAGNVPHWPDGVEQDVERHRMSLEVSYGESEVVRRVAFDSRSLPDGRHLLVGRDVTDDEQLMQRLGLAIGGGLVVCAFLAIASGLSISRGLLGRVTRMNETVLGIIGGRADDRVPHAEEGDEFDALAKHFNLLLDENDRLVTRMREVTDDVAHDLRTPLANMRTRIESALTRGVESSSTRVLLEALAADTDRILETFNDLIHIAKIENHSIREEMQELALDEVVRDVVELYGPLAEDAGTRLVAHVGEGVRVRGNRHLVTRALTNLLDNAIKYAVGSGDIEIEARRGDGTVELVVRDHGPGIPEGERAHVLERFVRLDTSRGQPGSGLGLSFVAAVTAHHGAALELSDAAPGLRVRIVFADT